MNVLVLGAYGLIGQEISAHLQRSGHAVTGLARDAARGRALLPGAAWIGADIAQFTTPSAWVPHLAGIDAVVNASGALQSGGRDNLAAVQRDAITALINACAQNGVSKFVQISAPGADRNAATEFMKTKGVADDALRNSPLDWVILKPGLVIAPTAYGGTSLLRALAAFPLVQPVVLPQARVQTVDVADVAASVMRALSDATLARQTFDLVEPLPAPLQDIVLKFRRWLGFPAPRRSIEIPTALAGLLAQLADFASHLGWRSPMRTTALTVLAADVVADAAPWRDATGETLHSLDETLARLPSTRQERSFARMELAFPALVVLFALFWILSGIIGIAQWQAAAAVVAPAIGAWAAKLAVFGGASADIAIGTGLLIRPVFRRACHASIALSLIYLLSGTVLTPHLWADPLGPFMKVFAVIGLAIALAAHAEER